MGVQRRDFYICDKYQAFIFPCKWASTYKLIMIEDARSIQRYVVGLNVLSLTQAITYYQTCLAKSSKCSGFVCLFDLILYVPSIILQL